ncbi:MAG: hydroxyacid dehydrogenase [Geminicoccaceae bacterium]|nr:hydroxyacid dehydrogenase [Geminicoccaceae bacterium]MCX7630320.1 hydroxyacid dehydrogenase [Geminicoccaceae bacterium]MDW8123957.1 hydroxyacid dehydrogenase [Geminicoccaceae bacterium]MDW8342795.1 hydroxyacid dehydrogenase [Geminicoccaceae bacterium]
MVRVLLLGAVHEAGLARLRARPEVELVALDETDEAGIDRDLPEADAVIVRTAPLPAARIARAPRLRVIAKHGVGVDNIDLAEASRRRIPVTVTATANATSVAEFAFAQLLALAKSTRAWDEAVRAGDWAARYHRTAVELAGKTLLVVGFGRIGARVAARALAFEMRVLAYDPYVCAERIRAAGCTSVADLDAVLPEVDAVSLHCPSTPQTRGMFDAQRLARLKPTAFLVNTARGGIVDEEALARALRGGRLAGAALDVFAREPLPASDPLLGVPGLLLSPHVAGITAESARRMALEAAENLLAALDGRLDRSVVANPEVLA